MDKQTLAEFSLYGALVVMAIYMLNLTYMMAIQNVAALSSLRRYFGTFDGLEGPTQFVLLLGMSLLFTITIVLKEKEKNESRGANKQQSVDTNPTEAVDD